MKVVIRRFSDHGIFRNALRPTGRGTRSLSGPRFYRGIEPPAGRIYHVKNPLVCLPETEFVNLELMFHKVAGEFCALSTSGML